MLQLLDQGLHVGRDYFFRGLLLLLVGIRGGLVDGGGGGVHGCFLLGLLHWPLPLNWAAACTYMPNASWRRRGVATASRGVSPPLQRSEARVERAERSGGLHKRSAEDWGVACGREGRSSP